MTAAIYFILLIFSVIYAVFKYRYELHMLQQNSYRNERYTRWLKVNWYRADRGLEFLFLGINFFVSFLSPLFGIFLFSLTFLFLSWRFFNKKHKKALVLTDRAKRILFTSLLLFLIVFLGLNYKIISTTANDNNLFPIPFWLYFIGYVASPIFLLIANTLLKPYEKYNHNWYINDAKKMLKSMPNLTIIGITGSYGKTSTKHFLSSILSQKYNVLMTPGSFNTPMGVVRTVREKLKPFHEVFIVEMGAKQNGDIKEICDIVHPSIGILTAVGQAHLDTFKTQENIRKTKFELIDSLPMDGFAVLNLDYPLIESTVVEKPQVKYGVENPAADLSIQDIQITPAGSTFSVQQKGTEASSFTTKLLGSHNLSNLAAAIAVGRHLDVSEKQIAVGIKKLQPVEHRLSIRKIGGGITILDDAFNSNPVGAAMAVEVLGQMEGKRKIIVTPGMVELGDQTFDLNKALGSQISEHADVAILVGQTNREALLAGLREKSYPRENIYEALNFADATKWLGSRMQAGDVILYENDLPDSYK